VSESFWCPIHAYTTTHSAVYITSSTVPKCQGCAEENLINRLTRYVRTWHPYRAGSVDPYRLVDLLERKDGPNDYQHDLVASNERRWSWLADRASIRVAWALNWTFGIQLWGGRDYGIFDVDCGPYRLSVYARWGLTESQRTARWLRRER
jgi:hypothetical protein